jgi:hypothetical protein
VTDTQDTLLDLIEQDPRRTWDRALIDNAVHQAAARNGGVVSTNAVRDLLRNPDGQLRVQPQTIGPRLRALTLAGVLEVTGWETNTDGASRNSGKPQVVRRLLSAPRSDAGTPR